MALPASGNSISFSQINTELGRSATASISLDSAENGTYAAINQCSIFKPASPNPAKMSEWFSYNHTSPCISQYCAGYSDTSVSEACGTAADCIATPTLNAHDFIIMRVNWTTGAGSDLDILFGYTNTGVSGVDGDWVGYGLGSQSVPASQSVADSYCYWNLDNTGASGPEAVSVNFTRLLTVNPGISANPIRFRMNAWWYASRGTGDITIEFLAYTGGSPVAGNQYNMLPNSSATLVDYLKVDRNVASVKGSQSSITTTNSDTLGYINYNPSTKKGTFSVS